MQSEAPSFQCTANDPGTGWDQVNVAVRRNTDTATSVPTFQSAQKLNKKVLTAPRLRVIQFIQSAFLLGCLQQAFWIQESLPRKAKGLTARHLIQLRFPASLMCSITPSNEKELSHRSGSEGCAPFENTLIRIHAGAQRQRPVGCSDLLERRKPI